MAQTAPVNSLSFRLPSDLNKDNYTYGAGACGNTITVAWNNTTTNYFYNLQCSMNPMQVWATASSSCGDVPGTDDVVFDDIPLLTVTTVMSGTFDVKISELPGHKNSSDGDGGVVINCPFASPTTKTQYLCGSISYSSSNLGGCGTAQYARALPFKFVYDTEPPTAPTIVSANAQDGAASVEFSVDSDTETVIAEVRGPGGSDFSRVGSAIVANTKTVRATGLLNSVTYELRLRAIDGAGNESDPSAAVSVTPILTHGLLGYYAAQDGELNGGCASAAGLMPLLFAAWALRSRYRRSKGSSSR